jgi:hypothetical protein
LLDRWLATFIELEKNCISPFIIQTFCSSEFIEFLIGNSPPSSHIRTFHKVKLSFFAISHLRTYLTMHLTCECICSPPLSSPSPPPYVRAHISSRPYLLPLPPIPFEQHSLCPWSWRWCCFYFLEMLQLLVVGCFWSWCSGCGGARESGGCGTTRSGESDERGDDMWVSQCQVHS